MNASLVILAIWITAPFLYVGACVLAERNERRRKAAHRAEVEQRLNDLEWDMIRAAVDETPLYAETAAYVLRKQLDSDALVAAWLEGEEAS